MISRFKIIGGPPILELGVSATYHAGRCVYFEIMFENTPHRIELEVKKITILDRGDGLYMVEGRVTHMIKCGQNPADHAVVECDISGEMVRLIFSATKRRGEGRKINGLSKVDLTVTVEEIKKAAPDDLPDSLIDYTRNMTGHVNLMYIAWARDNPEIARAWIQAVLNKRAVIATIEEIKK